MAELTPLQGAVLDMARTSPAPVTPIQVFDRLLQVPSYDAVLRALAALVSKGLLSKPRRGYYLPTEEAS